MTIQELFTSMHHGRSALRPQPQERSLSERECNIIVFSGLALWLMVMVVGLVAIL